MEHIAALLLAIGCSGDLSGCKELPVSVPLFETRADCLRELPSAQKTVGRDVPVVYFKCVDVDPALEEADAELVWDVNPDGTLYAEVQFADQSDVMVASNDATESARKGNRTE